MAGGLLYFSNHGGGGEKSAFATHLHEISLSTNAGFSRKRESIHPDRGVDGGGVGGGDDRRDCDGLRTIVATLGVVGDFAGGAIAGDSASGTSAGVPVGYGGGRGSIKLDEFSDASDDDGFAGVGNEFFVWHEFHDGDFYFDQCTVAADDSGGLCVAISPHGPDVYQHGGDVSRAGELA